MENWQSIDQEKAIQLLNFIFENLEDEEILLKYATALEKRFGKPEGTITNFIFYEDLDVDAIIIKLNTDTITYI